MKTQFKKCIALLIVFAALLPVFSAIPLFKADAAGTTTRFYNWKQYDPQWKDVYIGSNTIGNVGCYVTSAAILICYSGLRTEADFDPATLVYTLKEKGGFAGNLIYKGRINKAVPGFDYQSEILLGKTMAEKAETIAYYLNKGYYIIAGTKNLNHYVAIREVKNGVVYMMDPASEYTKLFDYYSVSGVTKIFLYTSTGKKVDINGSIDTDSTTPPPATNKVGIYETTDDLHLREEASTLSSSLDIIPEGTQLTVTEIDGIWGKTFHNGKTGYICLSYAKLISEDIYKDPSDYSSEDTPSDDPSSTEPPSDDPSSTEPPSDDPSSTEPPSDDPAPEYVPGTYKVTGSLNLRKDATTSSAALTVIPKGTEIEVTEIKGKWGKTTYKGYVGYCGLSYAKLIKPYEEEKEEILVSVTTNGTDKWITDPTDETYKKGYYIVGPSNQLRLRSTSSTSGSSLAIMPIGTRLKITEIKDGWGKTVYSQMEGWCSLEYCVFDEAYAEDTTVFSKGIVGVLGQEADLSSLAIHVSYSDGSVYSIQNGISVDYTIPTKTGTVKATATYNGVSYSINILYIDNCKIKSSETATYVVVDSSSTGDKIFGDSSIEIKTGETAEIDGISFVWVKTGDVDGTGDISITDYLLIKQTFLGNHNLTEAQAIASDVNNDGEISATDYLQVKSMLIK